MTMPLPDTEIQAYADRQLDGARAAAVLADVNVVEAEEAAAGKVDPAAAVPTGSERGAA